MNSEKERQMGAPVVGEVLRDTRVARHLTQEQVAKLAGISNTTVSEIEHEREQELPPAAARYARALGFELVRHVSYELRPLRRPRRSA